MTSVRYNRDDSFESSNVLLNSKIFTIRLSAQLLSKRGSGRSDFLA